VTKISAVIPDDVAAVLKERAKAEDRSVGAVIRRALAEHIGLTDADPGPLVASTSTASGGQDDDR
jgi:hypothetical protein